VTPVDQLGTGQGAIINGNVQEVTIDVASSGYTATATTLKRNVPVKLTLRTNNTNGCIRGFTIPDLGISKILPVTGTTTLSFVPTQTGRLAYSCSMGMFTGAFTVID
jgi:plastocyanin domain-containing protein